MALHRSCGGTGVLEVADVRDPTALSRLEAGDGLGRVILIP